MKNVTNRALVAKKRFIALLLAIVASVGTMFASNTQVNGIWYDFNSSAKTASVTYRGSSCYTYSNEYSGAVTIPASVTYNGTTYRVTSIGSEAFYNCSGLTSVTFGSNVTSIGSNAFEGCTGLTSITIPNSVTSIESEAFYYCTGLTSIVVVTGNTMYDSRENCNAIIETSSNKLIQGCQNTTIPNSVTSIGGGAFSSCTGLTSVTIPNSVTSIGGSAFWGCSGLTSVTIGNSVASIGDLAFIFCSGLTSVTIPNSVTSIGKSAFYNCSGLTSVTIGNSVTSIGNAAFNGCTGLTSITIPNSVTSIENSAFLNCTGLTSVTIGDSVTSIGKKAFYGCTGLTSVTIPNSVTSIGSEVFSGCSGLTSVLIGNSVTSIETSTFWGCSGLTSVTIGNSVTNIGDDAFSGCSNITSVIWNAKNCNGWNFGNQVESFTFGDSVEVIPANCCKAMNKLNTITIPQSVTSIGDHAFNGCGGEIASLVFPASLNSIGEYAFKDWTKIRQINIPNEVETIGAHAFDSCIFVTSIYLGNAVAEIGDYAFKGCIRVNDITSMNTTTPVVYENTLTSISPYAYLFVQAGSKRTYQLDPYWSRFDIREIASEETTVTQDAVTVEANEDNAVFTWPVDDNAASYSLQITKDNVVFCVLTFNANGQLIGIAFAPGRDRQTHVPAATTTLAGMSFTVTGLSGASKYAYRLAATDEQNNELVAYSGEFATTGYEGEITPGGEPDKQVFTIRFVNWDGLELLSIEVREGEMPVYSGEAPVRPDDDQYTYTFAGWSREVVAVTDNATYVATFTAEPISPDGITETYIEPQATKIIREDKVCILRGDKTYTITGQEVK